MIRNMIFSLVLMTLFGCATLDSVRAHNREKLLLLSPGMTKSEVLQVMGTETVTTYVDVIASSYITTAITNPYRSELYRSAGHVFEILLYYTDKKKADDAITDDELTPIIIMDGKLDGWGWSYWDSLIQKYEIRVR